MAIIKKKPGTVMLTQGYGKDKKEIKREEVNTAVCAIGVQICSLGRMNT